jgi:hypothetical protein
MMKTFTTTFLYFAIFLLFTNTSHTQLRFGIGGGLTSITSPSGYTNSIADNGEGFGSNFNFGAQIRLDIPLVPITPIFFADYHMLRGSGSANGFDVSTSQNILSVGVEAEFILLPLPLIKPYVSIEAAINNFGDLKEDTNPGSVSGGSMSRFGGAVGIGTMVTILPIFDFDLSLKYHLFNLIGKSSGEASIDAFSLNLALIL